MSRGHIQLLLSVIFIALFVFAGCKDDPSANKDNDAGDASGQENPKTVQYSNDIERLNVISEKICSVAGKHWTVLFGDDGLVKGSSQMFVDYSLFDRLSDDGVAAMIAYKHLGLQESANRSFAGAGLPDNITKNSGDLIENARQAGILCARAGFREEGFSEFLNAQQIKGQFGNSVSLQEMTNSYLSGYRSIKTE